MQAARANAPPLWTERISSTSNCHSRAGRYATLTASSSSDVIGILEVMVAGAPQNAPAQVKINQWPRKPVRVPTPVPTSYYAKPPIGDYYRVYATSPATASTPLVTARSRHP